MINNSNSNNHNTSNTHNDYNTNNTNNTTHDNNNKKAALPAPPGFARSAWTACRGEGRGGRGSTLKDGLECF